jgi:hypothetical protein
MRYMPVERGQDLGLAAHLDDLADTQVEHLVHWILCLHWLPLCLVRRRRLRPMACFASFAAVAARARATALSTTGDVSG